MRPDSMLEGLFLDVATPEDRATVDRLYKERNFGAAEQLAVRRIRDKWVELMNGRQFAQGVRREIFLLNYIDFHCVNHYAIIDDKPSKILFQIKGM